MKVPRWIFSKGTPPFSVPRKTSLHFSRATGEVVITLAYGPAVFEAHGQELIDLNIVGIKEVAHQGSKFWLVEYFPLCGSRLALSSYIDIHSQTVKYVPTWMPGANFKRIAAEAYKVHSKIRYWPWAEVNKQYVRIIFPTYMAQYNSI